jgi:hypothetical protein
MRQPPSQIQLLRSPSDGRDIPVAGGVGLGGGPGPVPTLPTYDSFEDYANRVALHGLNGGTGWPGPYVDRPSPLGLQAYDDFEGYADATRLNGLNGGAWTAGPYVDRQLYEDPNDEAGSWADFAVPQNGGTVSAGTRAAAVTFIAAIKAAGIRSKILRLNLYAGNNLAACLTPIIKDAGYPFFERSVGFVAGDYTEATGLTGNISSTKFLDPGIVPLTNLLANDYHLGFYNRSASAQAGHPCGCHNVGGTEITRVLCNYSGTAYFAAWGTDRTAADAVGIGLYIGVRDATETRLYRAGTSLVSNVTLVGVRPAFPIYFHALNQFGTAANSTDRTLAGYTIGKGLTGAEVTAFTAAWQAFQTSLARQV